MCERHEIEGHSNAVEMRCENSIAIDNTNFQNYAKNEFRSPRHKEKYDDQDQHFDHLQRIPKHIAARIKVNSPATDKRAQRHQTMLIL